MSNVSQSECRDDLESGAECNTGYVCTLKKAFVYKEIKKTYFIGFGPQGDKESSCKLIHMRVIIVKITSSHSTD